MPEFYHMILNPWLRGLKSDPGCLLVRYNWYFWSGPILITNSGCSCCWHSVYKCFNICLSRFSSSYWAVENYLIIRYIGSVCYNSYIRESGERGKVREPSLNVSSPVKAETFCFIEPFSARSNEFWRFTYLILGELIATSACLTGI